MIPGWGTRIPHAVWCGQKKREREKEIMPFATTWIELEIIIFSELSQKEKYKYHVISPPYVGS